MRKLEKKILARIVENWIRGKTAVSMRHTSKKVIKDVHIYNIQYYSNNKLLLTGF